MTAPNPRRDPVHENTAPPRDNTALSPEEKEQARVTQPAQSPARSPNDMLPPSAAAPQAPGAPGVAGELPSEPVTHRRTPEKQNPEPSERWFPPVSD